MPRWRTLSRSGYQYNCVRARKGRWVSVFGKWLFARSSSSSSSLESSLLNFGNFKFAEEKDWRKNGGMQSKNDQRQSATLFRSPIQKLELGKYCAQDIFCFVWSALVTFMSAAEGQRRWVRAARKPDHKISQKITKGNPIFFSQGMFHYSSRFFEGLMSLKTTKEYTTKTIKKQAGYWLKSRWVQNLVDILRTELYSNFG